MFQTIPNTSEARRWIEANILKDTIQNVTYRVAEARSYIGTQNGRYEPCIIATDQLGRENVWTVGNLIRNTIPEDRARLTSLVETAREEPDNALELIDYFYQPGSQWQGLKHRSVLAPQDGVSQIGNAYELAPYEEPFVKLRVWGQTPEDAKEGRFLPLDFWKWLAEAKCSVEVPPARPGVLLTATPNVEVGFAIVAQWKSGTAQLVSADREPREVALDFSSARYRLTYDKSNIVYVDFLVRASDVQ
jgi:hypothetical protein